MTTFYRVKPLLRIDTPLYAKRLARELNSLPDGFYVEGQRFRHAKFAGNGGCPLLQCRIGIEPKMFFSVYSTFTDAQGKVIHASRKQ